MLAGGTGDRMGIDTPKQFLVLRSKPIIMHSLLKFEENPLISDLIVVCHKDHISAMKSVVEGSGLKKLRNIVPGGRTRQGSSFAGIKACPPDTEFVMIHDASRPFVSDSIIEGVLKAAMEVGASGPVIDMKDTVVVEEGGEIKEIPPRRSLKRIQTPQAFQYKLITKAHEEALREGLEDYSDDCGMVSALGEPVKLVAGSEINIKITNLADLRIAEEISSI